jgi:WD40 repeat protein
VQVADALAYAHRQGILHRDIKPSNLLLDQQGTVWVTDFGLAKAEGADDLTQTGDIVGTVRFMAPERFDGRSLPQGDVYALGGTLYELLTLRPAFDDVNKARLVEKVLHEPPVRPRKLDPRIPRDLETVVLKRLAKDPAERYATAEALAEDLKRFLADRPIRARRSTVAEQLRRWCRRNPAVAALLGAVALSLLFGTAVSGHLAAQATASADQARANEKTAEDNAARARAKEEEAVRRREQADRANAELRAALAALRATAYAAHMNLAQSAWREAHVGRVLELLDLYSLPLPGSEELRDFEWHYLQRLCALDLRTLGSESSDYQFASRANVAFGPEGKLLATASYDGTVQVWDSSTGRVVQTLGKAGGMVQQAVAFSPDGKQLAAATGDAVRVRDLATGKEVLTLRGHSTGVVGVAFSPDGRRLASAVWSSPVGHTGKVKVWDLATAKEVLTLHEEGDGPISVAFSPDGRLLATGGWNGMVTVWDAAGGKKLMTQSGYAAALWAFATVAFSPDGKRVAFTGENRTVRVWDLAAGKITSTLRGHTREVSAVAFSPEGSRIASGGRDLTARIWDAATGEELLTLRGHRGGPNVAVSGVAFSPDGRRLATVSTRGIVKIWDATASLEDTSLHGHVDQVTCVAFSPDGLLIASGSLDRTVRIWDAVTGRNVRTLRGHPAWVTGVAFSADGRQIASVGDQGPVKVWEAATGRQTHTLNGHEGGVSGVAFSPDGRRLATAGGDRTVRVWDLATSQEMLALRGHPMDVFSVAFSPDGKRLASASWDQTVKVWDPVTGKELLTLGGHKEQVNMVAFSPDGRSIASASGDGTVKLWDAATGKETRALRGHASGVGGLAFGPGGRRLVSAGGDQTVKVWDVATGQEVLTLNGQSKWAGVAMSPDGWRIATPSDRKIEVWDGTPLTDTSRAQLEARSLLQFLSANHVPRDQLRARITRDVTISEPVRQRALALTRDWPEDVDAGALCRASWRVVRQPNPDPAQYEKALRQAETACRADPDNGTFLNTLGVAQYRAGRYQDALATLRRADRLNKGIPEDLAFLAMTQHRLGRKEEAQANLARLREVMKDRRRSQDEEAQAFLREAEALVEGKVAAPKE